MATRRMFSQRITSSARFLKMPISSQALYFHLCLNADDDGVVEAWRVMQLAGFGEDDIRVLATRQFVKILNDDMVTYILDWSEHNVIRADRKVDSVYKTLLLQIVPDAEVIDPQPRSDVSDNSRRLSHETGGQSTDSPRTSNGRLRLGKDRLGQGKTIASKDFNDVYKIFEAFKPVNPHYDTLMDSKKQYDAAMHLLQIHGLEKVTKVIAFLPTSNLMKYVTTITTPAQLEERWATLAAHLYKAQAGSKPEAKEIIT